MPTCRRVRATACLAAAGLVLATPPAGAEPAAESAPVQYVIVSFDGAHELAQWQRAAALAERTGARFTFFLSCVFLLSPETRADYRGPRHKAGQSNVGFAQSRDEVAGRLAAIGRARAQGHEIASHGCGHFDGGDWSAAEWRREFAAFRTTVAGAYRINGLEGEPADWQAFAAGIDGFRAPYLSAGPALQAALAEDGFRYDASGVSRGPAVPAAAGGLTLFSLPLIPEGPASRPVIAMDYNLFVRHSGGEERDDADGAFEARTLAAFRAAFAAERDGARRPLQLGFHFTLMNGGAYWRALERFLAESCGQAGVACVSYRDYLDREGGPAAAPPADPAAGPLGG